MFKKIISEVAIRAAVPGLVLLVSIVVVLAAVFWGLLIIVRPQPLSGDGNPFAFASDLATRFNVQVHEEGLTVVVKS